MASSCSAISWTITIVLSTWTLEMICSKIWNGIQTLTLKSHDKGQPFCANIYPFPKCICVSAMLLGVQQGHITDILSQQIHGASFLVYNLQQILFQVQYVPLHIRKIIELHTPEIRHCNLLSSHNNTPRNNNNQAIMTIYRAPGGQPETGRCVMGLLPDTQNCRCACAGNAGNVFPVTAGKRSRHASRHVRHARAVMHAGIAN